MRDIFYFLNENDVIEPDDLGRYLIFHKNPWVGEFTLEWVPMSTLMPAWVGKTLMDYHSCVFPNLPTGEPIRPYFPQYEVIRKLYV